MRKVKVKALTSFSGIRAALYRGQETEMEESLALRLGKCGYLTILEGKKEEEEKENKRIDKRGRVAASKRGTGGSGAGREKRN